MALDLQFLMIWKHTFPKGGCALVLPLLPPAICTGNLRTALYTWLIARKNGGDFILRIEDTDQGPPGRGRRRCNLQNHD